ncbi:hypothetical protein ABZP36_017235, partial [Zizania latifolia]
MVSSAQLLPSPSHGRPNPPGLRGVINPRETLTSCCSCWVAGSGPRRCAGLPQDGGSVAAAPTSSSSTQMLNCHATPSQNAEWERAYDIYYCTPVVVESRVSWKRKGKGGFHHLPWYGHRSEDGAAVVITNLRNETNKNKGLHTQRRYQLNDLSRRSVVLEDLRTIWNWILTEKLHINSKDRHLYSAIL